MIQAEFNITKLLDLGKLSSVLGGDNQGTKDIEMNDAAVVVSALMLVGFILVQVGG